MANLDEKSGIHLTGADSGWPVAATEEPPLKKPGTGVDGLAKASAVADGVVTALTEVVWVHLAGGAAATGFTLTLDGQTTATIAKDATGATVQTALEALSNVAPAGADLTVSGPAGGPYLINFLEAGAWGDVVPEITSDPVGVNEVQTLTVDATAGQYKLTYGGQQTADIDFDDNAAAVESALEALSNLAPADVGVTGGPGDSGGTTPYVITFTGAAAEQNVGALTVQAGTTPLSGGGAAATVEETTPGKTGPTVTVEVVAEGS